MNERRVVKEILALEKFCPQLIDAFVPYHHVHIIEYPQVRVAVYLFGQVTSLQDDERNGASITYLSDLPER